MPREHSGVSVFVPSFLVPATPAPPSEEEHSSWIKSAHIEGHFNATRVMKSPPCQGEVILVSNPSETDSGCTLIMGQL
jgi:hypothetical protein